MVSATASAVNVFPTPGGPLSWIIIPLPTDFALVGILVLSYPFECSPFPSMISSNSSLQSRCPTANASRSFL
jgi:hypothetical protein